MPKLILATKSAADQQNRSLTGERLINCFPVPAPEGSGAQFEIRNVPGLRDFSTLQGPFLRAMAAADGLLYVVTAGGLYSVAENGVSTFLAALADDPNTSMTGHRDAVTIAAGGNYYVWSDGALTQPDPGRLALVSSVAFLDQFTILSEQGGREVEWTEVGNPLDRNGLYFATAEARDDKIIRILASDAYFAVFKEASAELWGNTLAGSLGAFTRVEGGVSSYGLLKFGLACRAGEQLFYVSQDKVARLGPAIGASPVSTPAVNQALERNDPTHCFYYEDRGHAFCVIRFSDRPAWVYDAATGIWHERSSGVEHGAWDVIASAYCYGRWHLADRLGRVYRLGIDPWDADGPLRRTIVSRELYIDGARPIVHMVELLGDFGRSGIVETGPNWLLDQNRFPLLGQDGKPLVSQSQTGGIDAERPSRVTMRVSRDGGRTFGAARTRSMGRTGQYAGTVRFRALGQYRRMTMQIDMTDPVTTPLFSEANVEI